jgi:glutamine amidotransferase-like uncharacterized protein
MDFYRLYASINQKLARGIDLHYGEEEASILPSAPRPLRIPGIGVYTGTGTSHSWLWFVDLFDRMSFREVVFMDEDMMREGALGSLDVLAMSGGDTIRIAEGLGRDGAMALESFIRDGGLYIGSCAGAYLPLKSSKEHLDRFNFVDIKIANLSKTRPNVKRMGRKAATTYGCDFVYHPVREDVRLRMTGKEPFSALDNFLAPLYGGPSMIAPADSDVLAYYDSFTDKTLFLVDESLAERTLLGKVAAVRAKMGEGHLYLFGPHFEHPLFPVANHLLAKAIFWDMQKDKKAENPMEECETIVGKAKEKLVRDIKREISNSRIVAVGLETAPVQWVIGCKIYEPEKIRVFLEAIWKRIRILERLPLVRSRCRENMNIVDLATKVTSLLRRIKPMVDDNADTQALAGELFDSLRKLTMIFLQIYFDSFDRDPDPDLKFP